MGSGEGTCGQAKSATEQLLHPLLHHLGLVVNQKGLLPQVLVHKVVGSTPELHHVLQDVQVLHGGDLDALKGGQGGAEEDALSTAHFSSPQSKLPSFKIFKEEPG